MKNMSKLLWLNLISFFFVRLPYKNGILHHKMDLPVFFTFEDHPIMSTPMLGMRRKGQAQINKKLGQITIMER